MTNRYCRLLVGGGVALLIALAGVAIPVAYSEATQITDTKVYVDEPTVTVVTEAPVVTQITKNFSKPVTTTDTTLITTKLTTQATTTKESSTRKKETKIEG